LSKKIQVILASREAICKLTKCTRNAGKAKLQEQDTAKQLIDEASAKLSVSLKNNSMVDMAGES